MAKKKSSARSKSSARGAKAPATVVRNVEELLKSRKLPKGNLLIHFTSEQWRAMTRDVPSGKAVPKHGARLYFTPLPDDTGGIAQIDCIPGPCEICAVRPSIGPGGFGMTCRCRRDPRCPDGPPGGGLPPIGRCELRIERAGVRGFRFVCRSVNCTGTCRLRLVREPRGRVMIVCSCV